MNNSATMQTPETTEFAEWRRFAQEARTHLLNREFELLDRMADELRTTKAKFPGGAWKLHKFYWGLEGPADGDKASDEEWLRHIAILREWREANPASITAIVGLADALDSYGWKARGSGYAGTVSREGWR